MSHNLSINNNGNANFAFNSNNGLPWHGLGTPVDGAMTWREAMDKAGLGWSVSKRQLFTQIDDQFQLVDSWGIFRDDNNCFIGSVGSQYEPIQNIQAFDFVDSLLESTEGAHYDTAGALFNGERIFVSATIPYSIAPDRAPDDKTNCYLMFETSHDGSMAATAKLTTVRVVCNNTLSAALNTAGFGTLKVRHSQSGTDKLNRAKRLFQGVTQSVETLREKFNILANRRIGKNQSSAIMDQLFGKNWKESTQKRNQIERIASLFENNDNNAFPEIKGSAYNMLQAYTNWIDHERSVRKTDRMSNLSIDQVRTQQAVFNGGDALKSKALDVILQYTEDSSPMPEPAMHFQSAGIGSTGSSIDNIMSMVQ